MNQPQQEQPGPQGWQPPQQGQYGPPQPPQQPPKKNHTGCKIAGGVAGGLLLFVAAAGILGAALSEDDPVAAPAPATSSSTSTAPEPEPTKKAPEPEPTKDQMTTSQEQAIKSAESYLDTSAFSKKGLIDQLVFEQFSQADAKFAVNHVKVNWKKEAVESATSYLETSSFSLPELIQQLEFEGFTKSQAKHGAETAYEG